MKTVKYIYLYYDNFMLYSCFIISKTDNYTVSGMAFEKLSLQALEIIIVKLDIVIFPWNAALGPRLHSREK